MRFLKNSSNQDLQEYPVMLGTTRVMVPFVEFIVPNQPHILITAGLDGDEYTGIKAAYDLISHFQSHSPLFSVTIIPVLNIPGFEKKVSENPLDGLFPKHIYPGKINGKPTEQLMNMLSSRFIDGKMLWIDLHSGSLQENLIPFVWSYQTKNDTALLASSLGILLPLYDGRIIYAESVPERLRRLSQKGSGYLMLEAGQNGGCKSTDIQLLVSSVLAIIDASTSGHKPHPFSAFVAVDEYRSNHNGLWYPLHTCGDVVSKGEQLGSILTPLNKKLEDVYAKKDGQILWQKSTLAIQKNETLLGVGTKRKEFSL